LRSPDAGEEAPGQFLKVHRVWVTLDERLPAQVQCLPQLLIVGTERLQVLPEYF
jgi:hypothetical protein